jgi:PRTRC genetic system protein B
MAESINKPQLNFISGDAIAEIALNAPRPLTNIDAELLFAEGSYLLHYRDQGKHIYKALSAGAIERAFSQQKKNDSNWLWQRLVRHGQCGLTDWAVAFLSRSNYLLQVSDRQLRVPMPSFVFMGIGRDYFVWAVKETTFQPSSRFYRAPIPNVNAVDGKVCFGNVEVPTACLQTIKEAWSLFIESNFNQDLTNGKSKRFSQNILSQLEVLHAKGLEGKRCRYPLSDLVAIGRTGITVDDLVRAVLQKYSSG